MHSIRELRHMLLMTKYSVVPACQLSACFTSIDWTSFSEGDFLYD